MDGINGTPKITLRIPGDWSHPGELLERLPDGVRLTPEALILPDGPKIEFFPMAPDGQFPQIFESARRPPPGEHDLAVVARPPVNRGLTGPGRSPEARFAVMA